jgi:hypothetical protein
MMSGWAPAACTLVLLLPVLGVVAAQTNNSVGPRQEEQVNEVSGNLAPAPSFPMDDSTGKILSALIYTCSKMPRSMFFFSLRIAN